MGVDTVTADVERLVETVTSPLALVDVMGTGMITARLVETAALRCASM